MMIKVHLSPSKSNETAQAHAFFEYLILVSIVKGVFIRAKKLKQK
jgi:hypothetical protein